LDPMNGPSTQNEYLSLVIEALPAAKVVVDHAGRIALVNSHLERLLGYERSELIGEPVEKLVPAHLRATHAPMRDAYLTAPVTRVMGEGRDLFALRKDGKQIPVEIGLNPISTPEGDFVLAAIVDLTERLAAQEHLRQVVEATPSAIVVVDESGSLTLVNAQAEALFRYSRADLLGMRVEQLIPERFRGTHPMLRNRYASGPEARPMGAGRDLFALRSDGSEVPVEIGLSPLKTPRGTFVLASVIDITERKHSEELRLLTVGERKRRVDAEADRDRANDASHLKSEFVATMSHELRTPLNAIIGAAELLNTSLLDERQRRYVGKVNESAEALLAIISGILDLSKIEAGKVELEMRDFEIEAVVNGVAKMLASQARQKGIALHAYVDPLIPPVLRGDADRLRQILLNLVGNAVKFTDRGRVVVRALPDEMTAGHATIRFEVQDTGVGIPEGTESKLFEPFVQGDGSASRRFAGTGLGLSISKRLVELMQGEIGVTSTLGLGSLFWLTVRFVCPSVVKAAPKLGGAAALLLSEDAMFADIIGRYLSAWSVSCRRVLDAAECAAALQSPRDDGVSNWIALVDVDRENGRLAERALEAEGHLPAPRIITFGEDGSIAKPVSPSHLLDRITEALRDAPPVSERTSPHDFERPRPIVRGGSVLVAEDNVGMHEVLVHQFDMLGVLAQVVADGSQAVAAVRRATFDVIFMDCQMPVVDGYDATRAIREAERATGRHVPIVAMTANAFKEDREACLAAGMDDYIAKPVRLADLRAMLERWLPVSTA
jgi:two-component system sensor histidine kinase/response regulator